MSRPTERNSLLFEVRRFADAALAPLTVDYLASLRGGGDAPQGVERVHVERQVVEPSLEIRYRRVGEAVERREPVDEVPDLAVRRVEDVRPVAVDVDAADILAADVAARVVAAVDDERAFARLPDAVGDGRAEQACADDNVVVFSGFRHSVGSCLYICLRSRATGILSISRYLATVRRAMQ